MSEDEIDFSKNTKTFKQIVNSKVLEMLRPKNRYQSQRSPARQTTKEVSFEKACEKQQS